MNARGAILTRDARRSRWAGYALRVRAIPARLRLCPRAVAAPPFSGPRSRGTTEVHNGSPRHHQPSPPRARTPRMGPAPGGTTIALCNDRWRGTTRRTTDGARAGGSGYGRRSHSRCPGPLRAWLALMELRFANRIGCPASVDRRTYPGPPDLAPELVCARRRTVTLGRKQSAGGRKFEASRRRRVLLQRPRNSLKPRASACGWSWCSMWPAPARRSLLTLATSARRASNSAWL